jgi:diguanylate cyclase (GGDEF)-like protein
MHYPRPGTQAQQEWQDALVNLARELHCARALVRLAHPRTFELFCAYPIDRQSPSLDSEFRDHGRLTDVVLDEGAALLITDIAADARWDPTRERREGVRSYAGVPLAWPDRQHFGALEVHFATPLANGEAGRTLQLMAALAGRINLRLGLLFRMALTEHHSMYDDLTGLANRYLFAELASHHCSRSRRDDIALWLLQWEIHDYAGHRQRRGDEGSDALLRRVAECARRCTRASDVLARIGDNRFALLIIDANEFIATAVCHRIRSNVNRIRDAAGADDALRLNFGASPHVPDETLAAWSERVDRALQTARETDARELVVVDPPDTPGDRDFRAA